MRRGLIFLLLCACGSSGKANVDGGIVDAQTADAFDVTTQYTSPGDFTADQHAAAGCTRGALAGYTPMGIFSHDNSLDGYGSFYGVSKFTGSGATLAARVNGRDYTVVSQSADDLLVRGQYTAGTDVKVRAYDFCGRDPDGSLRGLLAFCSKNGQQCLTGVFHAVPLHRIPGEADASGLSLVSEFHGAPAWGDGLAVNVRVKGGVAYVADYQDGLRLVDVSDPTAPKDLGWSPAPQASTTGEIYNDVKVVDGPTGKRYALMASSSRGAVVIDVTDPTTPTEITTFPKSTSGGTENVHSIFVEPYGGRVRAYLADLSVGGFDVYDVTDPTAPVELGQYVHPDVPMEYGAAFVHDLYVQGGIAYLDYWDLGLVVVDARDPASMTLLGQYKGYDRRSNHSNWVTTVGGRTISVMGDEDFTAHMRVVDVTDPAAPTLTGELSLRPEVSIHNIMAFGSTAYVAWYQDGVRVVDLSDPTHPKVSRWFNTWSPDEAGAGDSFFEGAVGIDVDLTNNLIYVADDLRGLLVLRLTP